MPVNRLVCGACCIMLEHAAAAAVFTVGWGGSFVLLFRQQLLPQQLSRLDSPAARLLARFAGHACILRLRFCGMVTALAYVMCQQQCSLAAGTGT
jgi:hypothetical protein